MVTLTRRSLLLSGAASTCAAGLAACSGPEGTPASTSLHRLVDAARRGREKVVVLAENGSYTLARTLHLRGLSLEGNGAAVRLRRGFVGQAAIVATGSVSLSDLRVTAADVTGRAVSGVRADSASVPTSLRLSNVTVTGFAGDGLAVQGARAGTPAGTVWARGLTVSGCGRGVLVSRAKAATLMGAHVTESARHGAVVTDSSAVTVSDSHFNANGHAGNGHGLVILYTTGIRVSATTADLNRRSGVALGGGNPQRPPNVDFNLAGLQTSRNGEHGITLDPTIQGREGHPVSSPGRVAGCVSRANGRSGLNITCAADVVVEGNDLVDNGWSGLSISSARVTALDNRVSGNAKGNVRVFGGDHRPQYREVTIDGKVVS